MARIPYGILGEFRGRVGNVSGYTRMGVNFLRISRSSSTKPMTAARLAQQQKMKVCNEFTRHFSGSGFFDKTFPRKVNTATGYNKATSALMRKAICGSYPDISLAWPEVLISEGGMPPLVGAEAAVDAMGDIECTWTSNAGIGSAKESDQVVMAAFFPSLQQVVFELSDRTRGDESARMKVHGLHGEVHTWLGLISEDGRDAADSVYTGMLTI